MPIILYVGKEDTFSTIEDAKWLASKVPSVNQTYFVDNFDHTEFRKVNLTNKGKDALKFQEDIYNDILFHNPVEVFETAGNVMLYELPQKDHSKIL